MKFQDFENIIDNKFMGNIIITYSHNNEITIDVNKNIFLDFCKLLINNNKLKLTTLVDVSCVDYLDYGNNYWATIDSSNMGFSRGHKSNLSYFLYMKKRFSISYHLLSCIFNFRVRLRVFLDLNNISIPSVVDLWPTADWHEREIYDFFGIIFTNHPNLVRILTDYNFEGHPLRKDFPLTGEYEIRYDENENKIIREISSIKRVINTPKIIRKDFRYRSKIK